MTEGSAAEHVEERALGTLTTEAFLTLAQQAATQAGLTIGFTNYIGFTAYTNNGAFSWNAELAVTVANNLAQISSRTTGYNLKEPGKNQELVASVLAKIDELEGAAAHEVPTAAGDPQHKPGEELPEAASAEKTEETKNFLSFLCRCAAILLPLSSSI
ncbi:hypothetical protein [Niabella hibiscisoli]|uniref:hypothetical protein n=1 Tax=Niabella hibiscisoli TaxID=1825928 RepID=UPI001F0FE171|nr:hypothetical protein [Niabella hibiscisoli]MCH5719832.1 hypothetical protein [Niabella hibiscisoli]